MLRVVQSVLGIAPKKNPYKMEITKALDNPTVLTNHEL